MYAQSACTVNSGVYWSNAWFWGNNWAYYLYDSGDTGSGDSVPSGVPPGWYTNYTAAIELMRNDAGKGASDTGTCDRPTYIMCPSVHRDIGKDVEVLCAKDTTLLVCDLYKKANATAAKPYHTQILKEFANAINPEPTDVKSKA